MKASRSSGLSLQLKFVFIASVSIIVLMSAVGYIVTSRESRILYEDVERQGRLLAETLAIPVINDLIYERLGLVEEGGLIDNYVTEIFKRRDIELLYLAVLDENGRVVSHNDFAEYGKVYSDPVTLRALLANETIVQRLQDGKGGHGALDFATPLSIGKKRWGTLKFAISLEKVEHEIQNTVQKVAILTLLALLVGFGFILILSRRFIGPITQLARTMERAGEGHLEVKADIKGNDELALLGRSFNDMIDRIRKANIELKDTHERLLQSEKLASIGILASGVAHEINNPLGGLSNCVQILQKEQDEEVRKQYVGFIKEGLERIEAVVGKLLWMSRKDNHVPVELDVADMVGEVYEFVDYRVRRNGIRFSARISEGLRVFMDPHDFQQVLLNLLINATQAMSEEGGALNLRGYREGSAVHIEVEDTGEGIPEEHFTKIFDPFFTTKSPSEGTGLGLWMTYEIVKNYSGDIKCESRLGEGSKFTIILPQGNVSSDGETNDTHHR